jgi:hypothetical protein
MAVLVPIVRLERRGVHQPSRTEELNMSINHEDESTQPKDSGTGRRPYHAPRLVSLGSLQALVQFGVSPGSDGGPGTDCAFAG